ncbi:MAG: hypothetical protein K6G23_04885 [Lachnospiraceae bacterium]|nr:hypothetical protein [Lachnospiraceae bacterium]
MRITVEDVKKANDPNVQADGIDTKEAQGAQQGSTEPETLKEALREDFKKEKKKLSELHGTQKIEYLWDYYKWVIWVILGIAVVVSIIVTSVTNSHKVELFGIMMTDVYTEHSDNAPLQEALFEKLSSEENAKNEYIYIDTSSYTTNGELDYEYAMQLTVHMAAGELDMLILPSSVYETYDNDAFYSIEELFGSEFVEKYQDTVVGDGINITENEVLASYGYSFKTDGILVVCVNAEHLDAVVEFLKMIGYDAEL